MKKVTRLFTIVTLVVMILAISAPAFADTNGKKGKFVVTADYLRVHVGPSMSANVFDQLKKGTVVEVDGYQNGWASLKYASGHGYFSGNAYVDPKYLSTSSSDAGSTKTYYVRADMKGWLNVRSSATTASSSVGKLYANDSVKVYSITGEWAKINWRGTTRYVMSKYLAKSKGGSSSSTATKLQYSLPDEGTRYQVVGGRLRVRKSPSTSADILDMLDNHVFVKVISIDGEWAKVYYHNYRVGYVMVKYLVKK